MNIEDLPDEILIYIFKKLDNVEVLYSLMGVNERFNRIVHEKMFTRNLCFMPHCSSGRSVVFPDSILNRYCSQILSTIGYQIESLYLGRTSIERILLASNYPNLTSLGLCSVTEEMAVSLFSTSIQSVRSRLNDEDPLNRLCRNKVLSLFVTLNYESESRLRGVMFFLYAFENILATFSNLRCLKLHPNASFYEFHYFFYAPVIETNSTLLELHVSVDNMNECLYLLDRCFDQLRILNVTINQCDRLDENIQLEKPLPNLRSFSLTCENDINNFDETIVLILRRMLNLEELQLDIVVECNNKFIDGVTLKKDILVYLPRLSKFTFNICSIVNHYYQENFPSNEHIQKTFEDFTHDQIITCIDHFQEEQRNQCHIYSYPYIGKIYNDITNCFQGGLFIGVTEVSLRDEYPFELEFFLRITKSFSFIKRLTINNRKARINKQLQGPNNSNEMPIMEYSHLTRLDLREAHDDYVELFLFDTIISLSNNVHIRIDYQVLQRVAQCLRKHEIPNNCEKVTTLYFSPRKVNEFDDVVRNYFPHTRVGNLFDSFFY